MNFIDSTSNIPLPEAWIPHTQILLDSFSHFLQRELIPRDGSPAEQADRLFRVPFVVVSHGVEADPILNYGNLAALRLWEMDISVLTKTPSRFTAEPMHRSEREVLLARTTRDGYVDDYQGIRISRTGKRFRIDQAIVWNLIDADGSPYGQAATFHDWTPLASHAT